MRHFLMCTFAALLLCLNGVVAAQDLNVSGQVRGLWSEQTANASSPSNVAEQLLPGLIPATSSLGVLETELHLNGHGINAIATAQGQFNTTDQALSTHATAWINELYGTVGDGAWQLSAGRKVVAWDVGYGFRPNDLVQQEKRRNLIGNTLVGRSLATLDYFDANLAATLVWINPERVFNVDEHDSKLADEQALAARIYYRAGGADLHGFAKYGEQSGASVGAAVAWVATDALELHASARYLRHSIVKQIAPNIASLQRSLPWLAQTQTDIAQVLLGTTWTTEQQHSFLLEAWWDGKALSAQQWQRWSSRNSALIASAPNLSQYQPELAYNLAWQSQILAEGSSLQKQNLFARWSWQSAIWQPAMDILWTPQDGGRVVTASIGWQGDRWHLDGGVRVYSGPNTAVLAQLPSRRTAYVSATWSF
jgi:hypothetical protein